MSTDEIPEIVFDLHDAARYGEVDELKTLIEQKVDVDAVDYGVSTAMHKACANGHVECATVLINAGAKYLRNESGSSPLFWAILNKHIAIVRLLMDSYPELDILERNDAKKTPLSYAYDAGNEEILSMILTHPSAAALEKTVEAQGSKETESNGKESKTEIKEQSLTHEFQFSPTGAKVLVRELGQSNQALPENAVDLDVLGLQNNSDWTGLYVWTASILMSRWVVSQPSLFNSAAVLELGAGCGLPGLTALTYTPCRSVLITDLHKRTVDNIRHNLDSTVAAKISTQQTASQEEKDSKQQAKADKKIADKKKTGKKKKKKSNLLTRCSMEVLDWLNEESWPAQQFDVILGSDIMYHEAQATALCTVLARLLKPGGVFLMVHAHDRAGVDQLRAALSEAGFAEAEPEVPGHEYYELFPGMSTNHMDLHFPEFNQSAGFLFRRFTKAVQVSTQVPVTPAPATEQ